MLKASAILVVMVLIFIFSFIFFKSLPFITDNQLSSLFVDDGWYPTTNNFNLFPIIVGSISIMVVPLLLSAPLGILLALFCRYYAPKSLAKVYIALIELLSGIPSVVYGLWGVLVLVPWIGQYAPPGASLLAGWIIIAIMILPLMVICVDNQLALVPKKWLSGAQALSITRWGTIWKIVLPSCISNISSGLILQTGRALGETMAVLMVCGNIVQIPTSMFDPIRTLTANIALEMSYATEMHVSVLFMSGLILLLMTSILMSLAYAFKRQPVE